MKQSDERRISYRTPFVTKVVCHVDEHDKKFYGMLRDLSIIGLFMETKDCPSVESECSIDIILEGKHSQLKIEKVKGRVIRADDDGVAVYFDERLEWFALVPLYFQDCMQKSYK